MNHKIFDVKFESRCTTNAFGLERGKGVRVLESKVIVVTLKRNKTRCYVCDVKITLSCYTNDLSPKNKTKEYRKTGIPYREISISISTE